MRHTGNDAKVAILGIHERTEKEPQLFFLLLKDVIARTRYSQSTIYKLMDRKENPFPRPYRLSANRIAWLESEVNAWLRARIEQGPAIPQGNLTRPVRKRRVRGSCAA